MSNRDDNRARRDPRGKSRRSRTLDRRGFFRRVSAAAALTTMMPLAGADEAPSVADARDARQPQFSDHQIRTLAAVQEHLFPSQDGSPGAEQIRAMVYLSRVMADPKLDSAEREFIKNGIGWLEEIARESYGNAFVVLSESNREAALRELADTARGENWIATILMYIFEALLGDPAYGGNPGGIGWRWLQHDPGIPRPPADKIYGKL